MKYLFVAFLVLVSTAIPAQNKETCRVALVQAHLAWGNVEANLDAFQKRVEQCKDCDVIVFPELFVSGCEMKKKDKEIAVQNKDEVASYYPAVIGRMQRWAANSNTLVIGSTIYKEAGKFYNRFLTDY